MKRLFTFGCSFTRYYWPTWADILGREYDHFENWGHPGIGNRAILERLTECIVNNNITKDDTIIIQWTEIHRFDVHFPQPYLPEGWGQGGNILRKNGPSKEWIQLHWNEKSYVMHTCNFIHLAKALLSTLPCKWYMTCLGNLRNDIAEHPEFTNYLDIFDSEQFIQPPMKIWFADYDFPAPILKNMDRSEETDLHPIPLAHYGWLVENLCPRLNIQISEDWSNKANDILLSSSHRFYGELNEIYKNNLGWDRYDHWQLGVIDTDYATRKAFN